MHPARKLRRSIEKRLSRFTPESKKRDVLFYVGVNRGHGLDRMRSYFKRVYGFEANPALYADLKNKFAGVKNLTLINAAATDKPGTVTLHLSSHNGVASSLAPIAYKAGEGPQEIGAIEVPAVNLMAFCSERGITKIDEYVSDIQEFDLVVLKTLEPMVRAKAIGVITVECRADGMAGSYDGAPDNTVSAFRKFLEPDYDLVAVGEGILADGGSLEIPAGQTYLDTKWRPRV